MHIVVLHQYYLMSGCAGGSRFNAFAHLWAAAGHTVSVVAGNLDYSTGTIPAALRDRGIVRQSDGPVTVWRCPVPLSYGRGYLGRAWGYAGFTAQVVRCLRHLRRPDVVVATSPPLTLVAPAMLLARRWGAPWVFEMRDLWPESAITTGVLSKDGLAARALYALEAKGCADAACVAVLTPAFAADLTRRALAEPERLALVPNGADPMFTPGPRHNAMRAAMGWGDRQVFVYAGAHGRANGLEQIVEAGRHLRHRSDLLLACVGDGPERRRLTALAEGLPNVRFYGSRAKDDMPALLQAADAGLAVLQKNPTFTTVYPNKIFDCMAAARPLVLGIDGAARTLVCDQARAGVFAEPQNGADLAHKISLLADDPLRAAAMGRCGRAYVQAHLRREAIAARYLEVLQAVAQRRPLPADATCVQRSTAP